MPMEPTSPNTNSESPSQTQPSVAWSAPVLIRLENAGEMTAGKSASPSETGANFYGPS